MTRRNKAIAATLTALVISGLWAYWYFAPVLALRSMRAAAEAHDADTFNDYVDYSKLRESLKGQLTAQITQKMGGGTSKGGFAALGSVLGLALVDKMVDSMVRTELVMKAMQRGEAGRDSSSAPAIPASPSASEPARTDLRYATERKGRRYISYVYPAGSTKDDGIAVVLERSGFADWRLTELRLPQLP